MTNEQVRMLLTQLSRMAINGWAEGIDPRGQCEKIAKRIEEFTEAHLEDPKKC